MAGSRLAGDVSIIIVSWNTCDLLGQCLESLAGYMDGMAVYVVDNGSTDGSAQMVRTRFPQAKLVENGENVGFARANNQVISESSGRYVLLLNSDTVVRAGALEAMVGHMDENVRCAGCGPMLLNPDGTLQVSAAPMLTPGREFWRLSFLDRIWRRASYDMASWGQDAAREVEVLKGACLMLRREALDQVGLLDPEYFMYTEEVDLCHRLRQGGWKLYWVPGARVIHHGEGSTSQIADSMYVQLYRSKVQFFRKTGGEGRARLFKVLVALAYVPRLVAATAGSPFVTSLSGRARTFRRLMAELPSM